MADPITTGALQPAEPVRTDLSPFDADPAQFAKALERRGSNRASLLKWVKGNLTRDVDFGHITGRDTLWKPGAEKICGMLGLRVTFPNLPDYEQAAVNGQAFDQVLLRCQLLDQNGNVVGEGVGARSVGREKGDLNKTLKMAAKSAHIDATLRCGGLSEIFTQDLEDMPQPERAAPQEVHREPAPAGGKKATDSQIRLLRVRMKEAVVHEDVFKDYFKIEHMADLPFDRVNEALEYLGHGTRK